MRGGGRRRARPRAEDRAAAQARRERIVRGVDAALSVAVLVLAACILAYVVVAFATGGDGETPTPSYPGLIAVFGGATVLSARRAWRALRAPPGSRPVAASDGPASAAVGEAVGSLPTASPAASPDAERKRAVLELAARERGRLTLLEAAAGCGLTVEEAKATLDRLAAEGRAELHVTEDGVLVYVFPSAQPEARLDDRRPARRR